MRDNNVPIALGVQPELEIINNVNIDDRMYDIQLKENIKLFVSGPSWCGKTVFVSKLLENIQGFSKLPLSIVLYIYEVWPIRYD